ncbi:MAG: RNA polymerase subunit sigma-24 [Bradyrhizobiaceae bacterium PARB1]|nr:MAG: RNA polymerase subunit sigma-24 [Bradyrhizobiaceae bacterium PARB1]
MTWITLRDVLVARYDEFRSRLTRRLGSEELASESLQETWLRLYRSDDIGAVQSPAGYVLRVAMNIATDRRRSDRRIVRQHHVDAPLDLLPDPTPGPEREIESRSELEALNRAIATLPLRTRQILMAARIDGLSQNEIADRFGISARMVRFELRKALDHCEACLAGDVDDAREKPTDRWPE